MVTDSDHTPTKLGRGAEPQDGFLTTWRPEGESETLLPQTSRSGIQLVAKLGLDRKESSPPFWRWEPRGAGTRHRPCPLNAQWGDSKGSPAPASDPRPGLWAATKPPDDLGLLPTLLEGARG